MISTSSPSAAAIIEALTCGRSGCQCNQSAKRGRGVVHCPAHNDSDPSLSVTEKDGRVLLYCHGGCSQDDVIEALRKRGLWPERRDSTPLRPTSKPLSTATRWEIKDVDGKLIATHVRLDSSTGKRVWWEPKLRDLKLGSADLPLYAIERLNGARSAIVTEGEKACDALLALDLPAVGTVTGASSIPSDVALKPLLERRVYLWPDADDVGHTHMDRIAARLADLGHEDIHVIEWQGAPDKGDAADYVALGNGASEVRDLGNRARRWQATDTPESEQDTKPEPWPDIEPLPEREPAPTLQPDMIPEPLRAWLVNIADRASIPLEMVAVSPIIGLGALVGRQIGIRPNPHDDYVIVPNLYGAVIDRPGTMKSHAVAEGLKPLGKLAADARTDYESKLAESQATQARIELEIKSIRKAIASAIEDGKQTIDLESQLARKSKELEEAVVTERRYLTHDATVEKLGELLCENPNGLLIQRDEIAGWLRTLDKQGREGDREFYLEAWNGTGAYVVDRIGRGTVHIPALTLSIVGSIQPGKLARYINEAVEGGSGADGLLQRFQIVVWPDRLPPWKKPESRPNTHARDRAFTVFTVLDSINASKIGATCNEGEIPYITFTDDAQAVFDEWRESLEQRLRSDELADWPAFEAHLAKYRSLMPTLALLFHLVEIIPDNRGGLVSESATRLAIRWCEFLEGHARKLYDVERDPIMRTARRLAAKIESGAISDGMKAWEVYKSGWSGLTDKEQVARGLAILEVYGWLRVVDIPTGGRPSRVIHINPRLEEWS